MGGIYDGPYNHDCGWLGCTILSCLKARRDASEETLRWANIDRTGKSLGLPECGDTPNRPWTNLRCRMTAGHPGAHVDGLCDWPQAVAS